jgi:hypothetical protein
MDRRSISRRRFRDPDREIGKYPLRKLSREINGWRKNHAIEK